MSGVASSWANQVQVGGFVRWSYSEKLVTGTTQWWPTCIHGRQQLRGRTFDLVYSIEVLHNLPAPTGAVASIHSLTTIM
jgi:hypothetical protein